MTIKYDPERAAHKAWLGLLQPVGLVVSPPALIKAQAIIDRNIAAAQQALLSVVEPADEGLAGEPVLRDVPRLFTEVLGWEPDALAPMNALPETLAARLSVDLRDYNEVLRPDFAVLDTMASDDPAEQVIMLVQTVAPGTDIAAIIDLDAAPDDSAGHADKRAWHASPQARFERLLRDTGVTTGLLVSGHEIRLVYAPRGETSGHLGFPVAEMCAVRGRDILSALHMLLSEYRVFAAEDGRRLLDILADSRAYQSEVSTRLAEQVQGALWELLRGFEAADQAARGRVLFDLSDTDPDHIYGGLLTVIMRLVFLLYAEDQGLLPDDPLYADNYAVGGLYKRLREDAGRHPDTMDQRFGAWAGLLATFRLIYDGGGHGSLQLPTRHGQLFSPDEFPFLEGRPPGVARVMGQTFEPPRVSDGVLWRVLEGLLVLDGERLSYRSLDVEQIGSVYEAMMGFAVERAAGRSIGVRRRKKGMNLDIVIDIDALLTLPGPQRKKWLADKTEFDITGKDAAALQHAATPDQAVAAIGRRVSPFTPRLLPAGALYLQPTEERRRSGSHYTPRALTEPIVRTTLAPVIQALGERPTPEEILGLRVCDPAMGSGAFLVETCRQLAEHLVAAWERHGRMPDIARRARGDAPLDDPLLHARRLVAQQCLYGVDKNPFAVNLAKLSLWLVTLARDHAFTFLDHALKHGDSLVGLTRAQIGAFHWSPPKEDWGPLFEGVRASVAQAGGLRAEMQTHDPDAYDQRRLAWRAAEDVLDQTRLIGDLCVAAFFAADKDKAREDKRLAYRQLLDACRAGDPGAAAEVREIVADLRGGERPVPAFHWEIEFPEVFERDNPGFDAMVGNPPFVGVVQLAKGSDGLYVSFLRNSYPGTGGNCDLVAYFFRRAFLLIRHKATAGFIATNTIAQGDTRDSGLGWLCHHGGQIFHVTKRVRWPGLASVVVSRVHLGKGTQISPCWLDGKHVERITAFLFHAGGNFEPARLSEPDRGIACKGVIPYNMGFVFEDGKPECTPLDEMVRVLEAAPKSKERVFRFLGGADFNGMPNLTPLRYIIDFGEMTEVEARQWPELFSIVESKVKPLRLALPQTSGNKKLREFWWQYSSRAKKLFDAIQPLKQVLVCSQTSKYRTFAFVPSDWVFDQKVIVFSREEPNFFAVLQSRIHELWAIFFGGSMKDDPVYTPPSCFETFPFPEHWQTHPALEAAGQAYHDFRAALMIDNDQGLTATYNRFHDPDEHDPGILRLRHLHAAMDRAVLDAYGWTDIPTECDFLLDYDIDEDTWKPGKKKPWRYRWPEPVHDEVLARLLELNQQRYQDEQAAGLHADKPTRPRKPARKKPASRNKPTRKQPTPSGTLSMFSDDS